MKSKLTRHLSLSLAILGSSYILAEDTINKTFYGIGFYNTQGLVAQFAQMGISTEDFDKEAFILGIQDALDEAQSKVSEEEFQLALQGLDAKAAEHAGKQAGENLKVAEAFLAENAKKEGVISTESRLQYEIITKGEGRTYDAQEDGEAAQFSVAYKGTLTDGTVFDQSPEGQPVNFNLGVIPGFKEALTTMPIGSKWKLYLHPDIAYGAQAVSPEIQANTALIFELELLDITNPH